MVLTRNYGYLLSSAMYSQKQKILILSSAKQLEEKLTSEDMVQENETIEEALIENFDASVSANDVDKEVIESTIE